MYSVWHLAKLVCFQFSILTVLFFRQLVCNSLMHFIWIMLYLYFICVGIEFEKHKAFKRSIR